MQYDRVVLNTNSLLSSISRRGAARFAYSDHFHRVD